MSSWSDPGYKYSKREMAGSGSCCFNCTMWIRTNHFIHPFSVHDSLHLQSLRLILSMYFHTQIASLRFMCTRLALCDRYRPRWQPWSIDTACKGNRRLVGIGQGARRPVSLSNLFAEAFHIHQAFEVAQTLNLIATR
jgi:hypothetical protein